MAADLRLRTFASGTDTGDFTGDHAVNYSILCGVSGLSTIPLKCTDDGFLLTSGVNQNATRYDWLNSQFSTDQF